MRPIPGVENGADTADTADRECATIPSMAEAIKCVSTLGQDGAFATESASCYSCEVSTAAEDHLQVSHAVRRCTHIRSTPPSFTLDTRTPPLTMGTCTTATHHTPYTAEHGQRWRWFQGTVIRSIQTHARLCLEARVQSSLAHSKRSGHNTRSRTQF